MGFPDLPVAQPTAGRVKSLHREGDRRSTAVPCHRNAPPWRRPLTPVNPSILESLVEPATRSHLNEDGTLIKCTARGCARACMPCNHNRSVVCICMSHLVDNSIANVGDFSAVAHTRSAAACPSLEPGAHSDADAPVLPTPTSLRSHVPQTLINTGAPHLAVPPWYLSGHGRHTAGIGVDGQALHFASTRTRTARRSETHLCSQYWSLLLPPRAHAGGPIH